MRQASWVSFEVWLADLNANLKHKSMLWHRQHPTHTLFMPSSQENTSSCMEELSSVCSEPSKEQLSMVCLSCTPDPASWKSQKLAAIWILRLYLASKLPLIDQGSYRIQSAFRAEFCLKKIRLFTPFSFFFFLFANAQYGSLKHIIHLNITPQSSTR